MFNRKYKKAIHVIEEEIEECKKMARQVLEQYGGEGYSAKLEGIKDLAPDDLAVLLPGILQNSDAGSLKLAYNVIGLVHVKR